MEEYPSEYRQLSANVEIRLPKGFALVKVARGDAFESDPLPATLPHTIRFRSSEGMKGLTILLYKSKANLPIPESPDVPRITDTNGDTIANIPTRQIDVSPQKDEADLEALIVRDRRTQSSVYALVFLPLVLVYVLLGSLFYSRAIHLDDYIWNLFGFALGILTLRVVLVPSEVQALTRVDQVLSAQLITLISIPFLLAGLQLWANYPSHDMDEGQ
jgi:hypothetical protein